MTVDFRVWVVETSEKIQIVTCHNTVAGSPIKLTMKGLDDVDTATETKKKNDCKKYQKMLLCRHFHCIRIVRIYTCLYLR